MVRLPEPDREAQQAQIQELQDQIQGKKSRLDEIRALIEGKNAKRKGVRDGSSELRDELKAIRSGPARGGHAPLPLSVVNRFCVALV